jgi:hypothetical protein
MGIESLFLEGINQLETDLHHNLNSSFFRRAMGISKPSVI